MNTILAFEDSIWYLDNLIHSYGVFHFASLGICIGLTVLFCLVFASKHNKKTDDRFVMVFAFLILAIETFKQIFYIEVEGWYPDYIFPYQFCSVPLYVMLAAPWLKEGRVKEALYEFLAFFGTLAGISMMAYPESCITTPYLPIVFHTMIWHGSMIVVGIYLIVSRGYGRKISKDFLPGFAVYFGAVAVAVGLNVLFHTVKPDFDVNLFFISPFKQSSLPVFSSMYMPGDGLLQWAVLFGAYIFAFALGGLLIFFVSYLANALKKNRRTKA